MSTQLNELLKSITLRHPTEIAFTSARAVLANANKGGKEARKRALSRLNKARALRNRYLSGKPRAERYSADFEMNLFGIPVGVAVLQFNEHNEYCPTRPHHGRVEYDFDYRLVDRNGYELGDWITDRFGENKIDAAVWDAARGEQSE